jgi:SsrA-binding protein
MSDKRIILASNKKALFDFEIVENFEAWIQLFWYEVKAIRQGKINLKWSYVSLLNWQARLKWCHISPLWALSNKTTVETTRERILLLHRKDIDSLSSKVLEAGKSLLPIEVYLTGSLIKIRVGLGIWRKKYDKKQLLKERSMDKEAKMQMKKYI